jgi:hypothetical protein
MRPTGTPRVLRPADRMLDSSIGVVCPAERKPRFEGACGSTAPQHAADISARSRKSGRNSSQHLSFYSISIAYWLVCGEAPTAVRRSRERAPTRGEESRRRLTLKLKSRRLRTGGGAATACGCRDVPSFRKQAVVAVVERGRTSAFRAERKPVLATQRDERPASKRRIGFFLHGGWGSLLLPLDLLPRPTCHPLKGVRQVRQ